MRLLLARALLGRDRRAGADCRGTPGLLAAAPAAAGRSPQAADATGPVAVGNAQGARRSHRSQQRDCLRRDQSDAQVQSLRDADLDEPGGEFRYLRASINSDLTPDQMIATIAHELQHAVEVIADESVSDEDTLVAPSENRQAAWQFVAIALGNHRRPGGGLPGAHRRASIRRRWPGPATPCVDDGRVRSCYAVSGKRAPHRPPLGLPDQPHVRGLLRIRPATFQSHA